MPTRSGCAKGRSCARGRAHLFYVGDAGAARFKNFEFKARVKTEPGANSGIYFHTQYQASGFPNRGHEVQINNTHDGAAGYHEFKKTGSLYGVRNLYKSLVRDGEWFTLEFSVVGRRVRIAVNGVLVVDHRERGGSVEGQRQRMLSEGTFALQCHDKGSTVEFKDLWVRPIGEEAVAAAEAAAPVESAGKREAQIARLLRDNFPLVDFHAHLKGGLTLDDVLARSRATGIQYGIAPNCGLGFPITDDAGIDRFVDGMRGQPVFLGMQAEGREWVKLFSPRAIARFDYVFTDAMTFTDQRGKRVRLWIKEEVQIDDPEAFMEMYVDRIVKVLRDEPIDLYVNPTFLPDRIAGQYEKLWTPARMQKVIDAAVRNGVAIEINARYRLPSEAFVRRAKGAGVKFSLGTNNGGKDDLGTPDYGLDMIEACGLTWKDMFMPGYTPPSRGRQAQRCGA